jgi:hypothetical protein
MAEWTIKKTNRWHICRDGKMFATTDNEFDANEVLKFCKYDEAHALAERIMNEEKNKDVE